MIDLADLEARLANRLDPLDRLGGVARGDFDADPGRRPPAQTFTAAAVLAAIVRRPEGWTMLLTQRTETMPTHAGQVAFPGGRVQDEDDGPVAAALREAEEETGIARSLFRPIGGWDRYETGTGFRITPIVAFLEPGFVARPDPREVDAVFETPLWFLFDPANHKLNAREYRGQTRTFYEMPYEDRYIWGATAGMIRALWERLYR
jgi:8-oxo-dGTP pyrophosphatase MutT (NUDIX family)